MEFEDTQTANKPVERWSTPLVIREMHHHSEIPLCTCEGGREKKERNQVLPEMWRHQNPPTSLVGKSNVAVAVGKF